MTDLIEARFREALSGVTFGDWALVVTRDFLKWTFRAPCPRSGIVATQHGRKWRLSPHMTQSELVQTALMAALAATEHEARERFLYEGQPIFAPHFDVDQLRALCASGEWEALRA